MKRDYPGSHASASLSCRKDEPPEDIMTFERSARIFMVQPANSLGLEGSGTRESATIIIILASKAHEMVKGGRIKHRSLATIICSTIVAANHADRDLLSSLFSLLLNISANFLSPSLLLSSIILEYILYLLCLRSIHYKATLNFKIP